MSAKHTYDANGNQKTRATDTFTYDHENRLTQASIAGVGNSTHTYNGDGLRMNRTAGGTTNYKWDVGAGLPVVLQDGTNTYVYGLDLISATDSVGAQTYFLYDGLGSTTGLTDGAGSNPVSYSYDVFGGIRSQTGSSSNYWLFTGEQRDSGSNFYYLRARYYDPSIGRFLTKDPLPSSFANPQSLNPYPYVESNPTNRVDPRGLLSESGGFGDLLFQIFECVEFTGFTLAFAFLALGILGAPFIAGASPLLLAFTVPAAAALIAADVAVGYTAYKICTK